MTDDSKIPPERIRKFLEKRDSAQKKYHLALGQFIDQFAQVEALVQETLAHFAELNQDVAIALLSGVKVDGAKKFINRLLEVKPREAGVQTELDAIFTQLSAINDMRNDLVHYGAAFGIEAEMYVTNQRGTLPGRKARSHAVSDEIIEHMSADLRKIGTRLTFLINPKVRQLIPPGMLEFLRNEPWRYTPQPKSPPSLAAIAEQLRKPDETLELPPESSQE